MGNVSVAGECMAACDASGNNIGLRGGDLAEDGGTCLHSTQCVRAMRLLFFFLFRGFAVYTGRYVSDDDMRELLYNIDADGESGGEGWTMLYLAVGSVATRRLGPRRASMTRNNK